ncbi:hypothetical protein PMAYCL1PPCAC_13689, partial [Pristionchus mayeri]
MTSLALLFLITTLLPSVTCIRCQWLIRNVPGRPDFPDVGDWHYNEMRCSTYTEYCVLAYSGEMEFRDCDFKHHCSADTNGECNKDANGVTYCCCKEELCNSEEMM